ncbi:RES family NAD+ phosphorylase [soil metagenome]
MDDDVLSSLGGTIRVRPRAIEMEAHRVVESQHVVATRKLVDSDEEQRLLEELIDRVKPPVPSGPEFRGLHYLLFTSFRHPPLRWGSRFGTVSERGIWYGSKEQPTCFAEVAFYRLLFLEASSADLAPITVELTAFVAQIRAKRALDLTRSPFAEHESVLASKTSYGPCHAFGREMRAAGIDLFLFRSARSVKRGTNVGLFSPMFARRVPKGYEAWICTVDRSKVELVEKSFTARTPKRHLFPRTDFEVDGKLPAPS